VRQSSLRRSAFTPCNHDFLPATVTSPPASRIPCCAITAISVGLPPSCTPHVVDLAFLPNHSAPSPPLREVPTTAATIPRPRTRRRVPPTIGAASTTLALALQSVEQIATHRPCSSLAAVGQFSTLAVAPAQSPSPSCVATALACHRTSSVIQVSLLPSLPSIRLRRRSAHPQ
jgi:hypothetical protein